MPNFKDFITASYGASLYTKTLKLKEAKKDVAKSKNQFIFLQRCVKHKIIPKSLRIKSPKTSFRVKKVIERCRYDLLLSVKNDAKHRYFNFLKTASNIEDQIYSIVNETDMHIIKSITEKARESMFLRSKERLVKKFNLLLESKESKKKDAKTNHVKDPVLNLVPGEIPDSHKDLLRLGPKFVPNIKKIPYMDIVTATESSALKLEYSKKVSEAQDLRKDVLRILKTAKPVKDNLTRDQRSALKELKNDNNISIYPFDKGSGLVRIKNEDAITKIKEQIKDAEIIQVDPTDSFARDIRKELSVLNKKGRFTKSEYNQIYPSDAIPPRMYGAIKAHKIEKNYPMRIIVSTIGTPPHGLSSYLVKVIQNTLNKNKSRLKNSSSFVEVAKTLDIAPNEIQVSYDVVNLYPSVPLKEAIRVILDLLNKDPDVRKYTKLSIQEIKSLLELCVSVCYFIWDDKIYLLKDSGPIGLSIMVVLAEGFLQFLEAKAINEALHEQPSSIPLSFYRYVDDSHARFVSLIMADRFLEILNKQHHKIKYTIERENKDKELQFLDLKVKNNGNGKYEFDIFRKNAITNVQVKPTSSHDPTILKGIFKGFVNRAINICSEKYVKEELKFLTDTFVENGYPREKLRVMINEVKTKATRNNNEFAEVDQKQTVILPWIPEMSLKLKKAYRKAGYKVAFKSGKNLKDILTNKNKAKLPKNSFPGVYKIPCSCGITPYRGETKKKIDTRIQEHQRNVEKKEWSKSALALHSKNCQGKIEFDKTETVSAIANRFDRKIREALEIQMHDCHYLDGGMNTDKGQYVETKFWVPLLKYVRKTQASEASC